MAFEVDQFVDINLGVFGLIRPERFTGAAAGTQVSQAISEILSKLTFPSLNVLYSATAKLLILKGQKLKVGAKLEELELRVEIAEVQVEVNGEKKTVRNPGPELVKILGIEPSRTQAIKIIPDVGSVPDLSGLASALGSGLGVAFGSPELGSALGGIGSALVGSADAPKPRFPIVEKAGIASHREFSWYLKSKAEEQQEGTHSGTVFLQLSRQVTRMTLKGHLAVDWKGETNQIDNINITLDVHQPKAPKTPIISDFNNTDSIPLMVPRSDIKTLLGIDDPELEGLITSGQLAAFGGGKQITKGSLIDLLGL